MTTSAVTWSPVSEAAVIPTRRAKVRDLGFDTARLVASIAIVWAHTPRTDALAPFVAMGVFGTSFFAAAMMYFMGQSLKNNPQREFADYIFSRFRRLFLPFVAWSILYLLFRNASRYWMRDPLVPLTPMNLLTGGELHLWFLPYALVVSLAAFPVIKFGLIASPARRKMLAAICAGMGMAWMFLHAPPPQGGEEQTNFFICAWYALPSVFFGMAIALSEEWVTWLRRRAPWTTFATALMTAIFMSLIARYGVTVWAKNIAGAAWLLTALTLPHGRWLDAFARLAPLGFGLYLVHPMVHGCLRTIGRLAHWHDSILLDLFMFTSTVIVGLAVAGFIHHSRRLRWLVP